MKARLAVLAFAAAVVSHAQPLTSFGGATFPGSSGAGFTTNGGLFPTSTTLTSTGNLSVIGSANGSTGQDYEVRTKLRLQTNGGSLITYLRASSNAQLAGGGTFYAVQLSDFVVAGSSCSATLTLWRVVNGVHENKATATTGCADGATLRSIVRSNWIYVLWEGAPGGLIFWSDSNPITSGRPGAGALQAPADNGITAVTFFDADEAPPSTPQPPAVLAVANKVELQWPASLDGAAGSGLYLYVVDRRKNGGAVVRNYTKFPAFADLNDVTPDSTFEYWIYVVDVHQNWSPGRAFVVRTPSSGVTDPRRIGVRPEGSFFGGGGEQINVQSGNLTFTVPMVTAQGRNGQSFTLSMSHNSQLWRLDNQTELWMYGRDIGYGWGWRMQAGSITPVYRGWYDVGLYIYTDSTGAEYRLDRRDENGNWTTPEGLYLSFNDVERKLLFYDGSFWLMGAESADSEYDSGTLYPTVMQDAPGNQIVLSYRPGKWAGSRDTSGRLRSIRDVRSAAMAVEDSMPWEDLTWFFRYVTFSGDAQEHLDSVSGRYGPVRGLAYHVSTTLTSPWGTVQPGQTRFLYRVTESLVNRNTDFWYNQVPANSSNLTGEMVAAVLPYGGQIRWGLRDYTDSRDRRVREVQYRYIKDRNSATEYTYEFFHNDAADVAGWGHGWTGLTDNTGVGDRVWWFSAPDRLISEQRRGPNYVVKSQADYVWSVSPSGRSYISQATTSILNDNGTGLSRRQQQTLDGWGNVTLRTVTDFGLGNARTYKYDYAHSTDTDYRTRYVLKAMRKEWKWETSEQNSQLLREIAYDTPCQSLVGVPLNAQGQGPALFSQSTDPVCKFGLPIVAYDSSRVAIGFTRYRTGVLKSATNADGEVVTTVDSRTNWTAPSELRANNDLTTVNWDGMLNPSSSTNPNGGGSGSAYDMEGRLQSASGPDGQTMTVTENGFTKTTSVRNGAWERTTFDGYGRPKTVERGFDAGKSVVQNVVSYVYEPCSCAPFGKLKKQSLRRQPNAPDAWTTTTYDILGRTTNVAHATGGSTVYTHTMNVALNRQVLKITPPDGRWKEYRSDGFGNLREVVEPKTDGSGTSDVTSYTYDDLNRLSDVSMSRSGYKNGVPGSYPQSRSFTYDAAGRIKTNTMPEMGSAGTPGGMVQFEYNGQGKVKSKTDAMGRVTKYEYDSSQRLQYVKRFPDANANSAELTNDRIEYIYDYLTSQFLAGLEVPATDFQQNNGIGRVVAVKSGVAVVELFAYTDGGQLQRKRTIAKGQALEVRFTYDIDGRLQTITYPSGRVLKYGYGDWGRASSLQNPNGFEYFHATLGWHERVAGIQGNGSAEGMEYNAAGQLTRWWSNSIGKDMRYVYDWPGGYNNGKLYQQVDANAVKTTTYYYDVLGRLERASSTAGWSQSYDFDGFGNLWQATGSGGAPSWNVSARLNSEKNQIAEVGRTYDAAGNSLWAPGVTYDHENRMRESPSGTWGVNATYEYSADNKRVIKLKAPGAPGEEGEVTLWANGQRLAVVKYGPGILAKTEYAYFAGKRFVWNAAYLTPDQLNEPSNPPGMQISDRLGSSVEHLPFGDQIVSTPDNAQKFTGYWRDAGTGLDYADQRYYVPGAGRFMTADPYQASAGAGDPGSWNRYAYVQGDPVNLIDPRGLESCRPEATCVQVTDSMPSSSGAGIPGYSGGLGGGRSGYEDQLAPRPEPSDAIFESPYGSVENCTFAESLMNECGDGTSLGAAIAFRGLFPAAAYAWSMARLYGYLGEKAVSNAINILEKNTKTLTGSTVSGTNRIPDFWNRSDHIIYEVKNVASLSWTSQIRDMAVWARQNEHKFELWFRDGAELSDELIKQAQIWGVKLVPFSPWQ